MCHLLLLLLAAAAGQAPTVSGPTPARLYFSATGVSRLVEAPVFVWLRDTACEHCNRSLLYTLQRTAQPATYVSLDPAAVELSVSRCNLTEADCAVWHNATTRLTEGGVRLHHYHHSLVSACSVSVVLLSLLVLTRPASWPWALPLTGLYAVHH